MNEIGKNIKYFDVDKYFLEFLNEWVEKNISEYARLEDLEEDMAEIYLEFIKKPAKWLEGLTPEIYFDKFKNAKVLIEWMEGYIKKGISVPQLLIDRIFKIGSASEHNLMALLKDEKASQEGKMIAVNILKDFDSLVPMELYIDWQLDREEKDDLKDSAIESLKNMGDIAAKKIEKVINDANEFGQEALLDVLVENRKIDKALELSMKFFKTKPKKRALYAGYLGKLCDIRAFDLLKEAALDPETEYLDYIEIRSAIEALGENCPEREFEKDEGYEALWRLQ